MMAKIVQPDIRIKPYEGWFDIIASIGEDTRVFSIILQETRFKEIYKIKFLNDYLSLVNKHGENWDLYESNF